MVCKEEKVIFIPQFGTEDSLDVRRISPITLLCVNVQTKNGTRITWLLNKIDLLDATQERFQVYHEVYHESTAKLSEVIIKFNLKVEELL